MPSVLLSLQGPLTVWLDSHPPDGILTSENTPVLAELTCLASYAKRFPVVIMIDDMRLFSDDLKAQVIGLVKNLFPDQYRISYLDNHIGTADIMLIH